jgi:hypothetical protein
MHQKTEAMKTKQWILLGGVMTIGAALSWWLLGKRSGDTEKPPKNAPQIPIDNPGDQSEFHTSPGESEIG